MTLRARRSARIGSIWDAAGSLVDAAGSAAEGLGGEVVDNVEDVVDAVSDAGAEIGHVLKFIAPIVALWPGIGTAVSIALSAAAAYACGDPIDKAAVDLASNAIPGGVPRAVFNTGADVTRAAVRGEDIKAATIRGMRSVASSAGGERAVAAFDTGLAVARGQKIQDATWRLARENAKNGGTATLAAFDAGAAIANGGDVEDVAVAVARDYAATAGGPLAAAAFDGGLAIARGQSLQEAGFASLKAFAAGNDLTERALNFADKMARAARRGESIEKVLVDELVEDVDRYGGALVRSGAAESVKTYVATQLEPIIAAWPKLTAIPYFDDLGSYALAEALGVAEEIARAAQAVMREGVPDETLLNRLTKTGVQNAIEKYGAAVVASRDTNKTYGETEAEFRSDQLELVARMPAKVLSYATAKEQQATPSDAPPTIVEVPSPPSSPRHSPMGDVALGGVIAAAAVALFFWAKS